MAALSEPSRNGSLELLSEQETVPTTVITIPLRSYNPYLTHNLSRNLANSMPLVRRTHFLAPTLHRFDRSLSRS